MVVFSVQQTDPWAPSSNSNSAWEAANSAPPTTNGTSNIDDAFDMLSCRTCSTPITNSISRDQLMTSSGKHP